MHPSLQCKKTLDSERCTKLLIGKKYHDDIYSGKGSSLVSHTSARRCPLRYQTGEFVLRHSRSSQGGLSFLIHHSDGTFVPATCLGFYRGPCSHSGLVADGTLCRSATTEHPRCTDSRGNLRCTCLLGFVGVSRTLRLSSSFENVSPL